MYQFVYMIFNMDFQYQPSLDIKRNCVESVVAQRQNLSNPPFAGDDNYSLVNWEN